MIREMRLYKKIQATLLQYNEEGCSISLTFTRGYTLIREEKSVNYVYIEIIIIIREYDLIGGGGE